MIGGLTDTTVLADQIIDAGRSAVLAEPRLAPICQKLSSWELRALIAVIVSATATIALRDAANLGAEK